MAITRVSPALIQVANNVTSTTIGNTTSIPSLTFDASGVIVAATNTTVSVANTNITGNITSSQIVPNPVFNGNTTVTNLIVGAGSNTAPSIVPTGDTNTGIFFPAADTIAFAEGGAEAMRIDSNGNVGIGTTSSASKLQAGAKTSSTSSDVSTIFSAGGASASGGQIYAATFCNTVASANNNEVLISFTPASIYSATGAIGIMIENDVNAYSCLKFYSYAGNLTERVRIDSLGSLLINETSNGYGVTGGIYAPSVYTFTTASAANMFIESGGFMRRSTSSIKYKTDVQDATHGLVDVMELRPVTYKGINDGEKVFGGLIAEEVHDAGLTEFVQYAEDGSPDALAYGNMVSLAFKAIQELKAINDAQASRIETLESEVAALKSQNIN